MPEDRTFYQILGVSQIADAEEIRRAYLQRVKDLHPDKLQGVSEAVRHLAEEELKAVNLARDVLLNPVQRLEYNAELTLKRRPAGGSPKSSPPPIPNVTPAQIEFTGIEPGEVRTSSFVVDNSGGTYQRLSVSNPNSWVRVTNQEFVGIADKLPLRVHLQVIGRDWGQTYSETIEVKLDERLVIVGIRLNMATRPAYQDFQSEQRGSSPPLAGAIPAKKTLKNFAWTLGMMAGALLLLIVVWGFIVSSPSASSEAFNKYYRGRFLDISPVSMERYHEINYRTMDEEQNLHHWRIKTQREGFELLLLRLKVENHIATRTSLMIDAQGVELRDQASQRFTPLDINEWVEELVAAGPNERGDLVFLWGPFELQKDFGVDGYMVFEIPKGLRIEELRWRAGDSLSIDFTP